MLKPSDSTFKLPHVGDSEALRLRFRWHGKTMCKAGSLKGKAKLQILSVKSQKVLLRPSGWCLLKQRSTARKRRRRITSVGSGGNERATFVDSASTPQAAAEAPLEGWEGQVAQARWSAPTPHHQTPSNRS